METPVIHFFHGMEDAALNRFKAVFYGGHCTLEDYIGGIVQKIAFVHTLERGRAYLVDGCFFFTCFLCICCVVCHVYRITTKQRYVF